MHDNKRIIKDFILNKIYVFTFAKTESKASFLIQMFFFVYIIRLIIFSSLYINSFILKKSQFSEQVHRVNTFFLV